MQAQFKLEGAEHLHRSLLELSKLYDIDGERVIKHGLRKAGGVVAEEMKRRIPVDTGKTRDSIGVGAAPKRDLEGNEAGVVVGASKKRAYIARFLELGTSKRRATPHAGPAFDASAGAALGVFVREASKALKRAARRAARGMPR